MRDTFQILFSQLFPSILRTTIWLEIFVSQVELRPSVVVGCCCYCCCWLLVVPRPNASRSPTFPRSPHEFSRLAWILATIAAVFPRNGSLADLHRFDRSCWQRYVSPGTDFASVRTYFPRKSGGRRTRKTDREDGRTRETDRLKRVKRTLQATRTNV